MAKSKRNALAAVAISFSLAGCMTAEQMGQECRSYGFVPGTQGYAQCRMTLAMQQQQARNEAADQMASGFAAAGAAYSHPVQTFITSAPVVTNCTGYGSMLSCTSHPQY